MLRTLSWLWLGSLQKEPRRDENGCLPQRDAELDVLNHPLLNIIYYSACELVPSALVLYILRKLPPKRSTGTYHQIPAQ